MNHDVIERIDPKQLTPHPDNSMKHGEGQITSLVASFEQFGFNGVIVIDENNVVLAGHGRRLAAIRSAMPDVPCLRRTGLTDAQKRAYIIADNKIGRDGEWDQDVLRQQIEALNGDGFDLDSLGISAAVLASIQATPGKGASGAGRQSGERAKPLEVKLDADKLRRVACELSNEIRADGYAQAKAVIGAVDGVTYQLVAFSEGESATLGLVAPQESSECLTKAGRRKSAE